MPTFRLFSIVSAEEQWSAVAGPWLRAQSRQAWREAKPTVVLTPGRAESFYLRSRLVEEGQSCLGIRFWTPSDARKFLLAKILPTRQSATQADQRLIARLCAEKLAQRGQTNNATLHSVIREPGAFLRAYDLLLGAGWDPARDGVAYGRELAAEFQAALENFGVATQAGLHLRLRREIMAKKETVLASLLVIGFNGTHWPLWDLLKALTFSAEDITMALAEPRVFGETVDQLWISSWEEVTSSEANSPSAQVDVAAPFASLATSYEQGVTDDLKDADLTFRATPDLTSQVRAIVLQALVYLKCDSCSRLGIVFPQINALALGVAEQLREMGIPLDNGIGAHTPGIFERRSWLSWLALQEEPGLPRLIAWVRACEAEGLPLHAARSLSTRTIAKMLDEALGETLVDDLGFLARYLEEHSKKKEAGTVAKFLRRRVALPDKATFSEFLELTRQAHAAPGWEKFLNRLNSAPPAWLQTHDIAFSRRAFLEWLKETTNSMTWSSGREGNHFYGRVHLTIYAQMSGQKWSHLILTGLNEGIWPREDEEGAFGSRHEWMMLNQRARKLNLNVQMRGRQGEGHTTVKPEHGYCLLPFEKQELALRDLCAALESTSVAACLSAMSTEGGRSLMPSDFFSHAYQAYTGKILDDETFRRLANATLVWCRKHDPLFIQGKPVAASFVSLESTKIAHEARRNAKEPFGRYEFAFEIPPSQPIQLHCKRWEDALGHPSIVWLEDVIGTPAWPTGTLSWQRAIGTWVHDWLSTALREEREHNLSAATPALLSAAADSTGQKIKALVQQADAKLCLWWEPVWAQARAIALGIVETLVPHLKEKLFLCEFRLPSNLQIALPGTDRVDFELKGRIDLLLVDNKANPGDAVHGDLAGTVCWVIDFKTGAAKNLSLKTIATGRGLQPVLYALAVRACGAASTGISLHTMDTALKRQVDLDDVMKLTPLFRSLDILHRDGIFGMRADADNAYGYAPAYPIATRFVPGTILKAKWAKLHGGDDEGDDG